MDIVKELMKRQYSIGDEVRLCYIKRGEAASKAIKLGDILEVVAINTNSDCKNRCNEKQRILCDQTNEEHSMLFIKKGVVYDAYSDKYTISSCYCLVDKI